MITGAALDEVERRVLDRFRQLLRAEFGDDLVSVRLYGSRARGEQVHDESDVDLLVVIRGDSWESGRRVSALLYRAAEIEGANPAFFAPQVYSVDELERRRAIRSFFIQEVDRDKIVLAGEE